jgi:hypothetical protein
MDGNPQSLSRRVYFPKTASSWHLWFDNATSYTPGTWADPNPHHDSATLCQRRRPRTVQYG